VEGIRLEPLVVSYTTEFFALGKKFMHSTVRGVLAVAAVGAVSLSACSGAFSWPAFAPPESPQSSRATHRSVVPAGSPYKVLYVFAGGSDGASPYAGLIKVNALLYGTTQIGGGIGCPRFGCGTVYDISTDGKESVLHRFAGGSDGEQPSAGLAYVNGQFYGTTGHGGGSGCDGYGCGTVYSVSKSGIETVLHHFGRREGTYPLAGLTNMSGTLYGTTFQGSGTRCGGAGCGTVYSVSTTGVVKTLHQFGRAGDGANPATNLIEMNKRLYGTTSKGGGSGCGGTGCGTVYTISATGVERVVYRFRGGSDGAYPNALTKVNGTLFGTTQGGGDSPACADGCGTVYSLKPNGAEGLLYNFKGRSDGAYPVSGLINVTGTLYGTTSKGGSDGLRCSGYGCGTVYSVSTAGAERVLHRFAGRTDFDNPVAPLIFANGNLYGTTTQGGRGCYGPGCGTVFALSLP
jgi:uncharacterized repeat protein (TIGR03803 family)